jgi:tetratricopeptide (TPR) repeat protein
MCTILSELGKHQEALGHARTALKMLLMEMFGPDGYASATEEGGDSPPKLPADRVAVLVIAYHNLAVQLEHLKKYKKSLSSYEKAVKVCTTHLEETHPLVANITESYNAACQNLGALIAKQEQIAINKAHKTAKRQGLKKTTPTKAGTLTSDQLNTIVLETEQPEQS